MRRVNDLALLPPAPLEVSCPDCGMEAGDLVAEDSLRSLFRLQKYEKMLIYQIPENR